MLIGSCELIPRELSIRVPVAGRVALGDFYRSITFTIQFVRGVHSIRYFLISCVPSPSF